MFKKHRRFVQLRGSTQQQQQHKRGLSRAIKLIKKGKMIFSKEMCV